MVIVFLGSTLSGIAVDSESQLVFYTNGGENRSLSVMDLAASAHRQLLHGDNVTNPKSVMLDRMQK